MMNTGWTIALVIAASLSAQSAGAADQCQGDPGINPLLRLLTATRLVCPDVRLAESLGPQVQPVSRFDGLQALSLTITEADFSPTAHYATGAACRPDPRAQLLRFDIEVRGP